MSENSKPFDCVQTMRQIRDGLSAEMAGMSYDELTRWLRAYQYSDPILQRLAERAVQQTATATAQLSARSQGVSPTEYHKAMGSALQLDEDLLREVERVVASKGQTLASTVEQALREMLARRVSKREPVQLPTFRGRGLKPGVDLDNSAGLLDLMERSDDSG